jgi:two-component system chemotaxis response regulator CheY
MSMSSAEPKLRAVVVDDEAFIRQVLTRMLEKLGFAVVAVAGSGAPVLDLYADLLPDLVVMDIAMPEVDGLTTLGRLKQEHPEATVVICTSFTSPQYATKAERLGAAAFLNKPFDLAGIRSTLEALFPGRLGLPVS